MGRSRFTSPVRNWYGTALLISFVAIGLLAFLTDQVFARTLCALRTHAMGVLCSGATVRLRWSECGKK